MADQNSMQATISSLLTGRPIAAAAMISSLAAVTAYIGAVCSGLVSINGTIPTPQCIAVETYGGGTTVADNTAALVATRAALPASGGCIRFGMGTYRFTQEADLNLPNAAYDLFIAGSGEHSTKLVWPAGSNGIVVGLQNGSTTVHTRDMSIVTAGASPATAGLTYKNSLAGGANAVSDVQHVAFLGVDGGQVAQYWGTALKLHQIWNVTVADSSFYGAPVTPTASTTRFGGTGVLIEGDAPTNSYGTIYNLSRNVYDDLHRGVIYGSFIQGVTMDAQNMISVDRGISVEPATGGVLAQLSLINSQFANATEAIFKSDSGIIDQMMLTNNLFFGRNNSTIWDMSAGAFTFSSIGNTFTCTAPGNASYGLVMGGTNSGATSSKGNLYTGCTTAITLKAASSNVTVDDVFGNGPLANGLLISDAGTNNSFHSYQPFQTHNHISLLGPTPAISASGGGRATLDPYASDSAGMITTTGTITSVTATWAKAYSNNPHCIVSSNSGTPFTGYAAARDHLSIFLASVTAPQFTYICTGP